MARKLHPANIMGVHRPIRQYFTDVFPGIRNPLDCPLCGADLVEHGAIDIPPIAVQMTGEWRWKATRYFCERCQSFMDVVDEWEAQS